MPLDQAWVQAQFPSRRISWFASIDSTMFAASRLAFEGAASGTVVGAEEQTAGYGRYGRTWHSEPEAGLYFSVILRFPFSPDTLPLVVLALGLAAADAILKATGLVCDLRWPNDLLMHEKKCAGILPQLEGAAIVAGFGVNVNHASFPSEIAALATSLRMESAVPQSREKLLAELLPAIDSYCEILLRDGKRGILDMFTQASSYVRGRRVRVDQGDSALIGITTGLNDAGFLMLRDDAGNPHTIMAGGVRPCS